MSNVMDSFGQIFLFLRCLLSKYGHVTMQISKIFYFVLILNLMLRKFTKFLVEKLSSSEVINQKPHGGGEHPSPSVFRVK